MSDEFVSLVERGNAARYANDFDTAGAAYEAALRIAPGNAPVEAALGLLRLAEGRYAEGWALYEARKSFQPVLIEQSGIPEWRGESLKGKSLTIWPEQGLGDEIQMSRYAPVLWAMGAQVVLVCSPLLTDLFRSLKVILAPMENELRLPPTSYYVRNLSLPALMGTTLETIPPAPYLQAPTGDKTGGVGFVWRGNPEHPNDAGRSLPSPAVLEPLGKKVKLVDLQDMGGDFLDSAIRIQGLDMVITVDTAMAHLCGALGVPCWVMLPAERIDWRWMTGRSESPWYPSLRLFRQTTPGDWDGVVQQMLAALAEKPD
jgi:hypothetical protein